MSPTYKLTYFNLKGKGETIRLAFAVAGIPFEDFRVEFDQWSHIKPTIVTGQLPCLEVDGKQLSESTSIARYVAREGSLLGSNNFEQAEIESVADAVDVVLNIMAKYKWHSEGNVKEELHKEVIEKHLPGIISLCELKLEDKKFFVLDKLTLAELHFYSVFSNIKDFVGFDWQAKSPKLKALFERIEQEPKMADYLKATA